MGVGTTGRMVLLVGSRVLVRTLEGVFDRPLLPVLGHVDHQRVVLRDVSVLVTTCSRIPGWGRRILIDLRACSRGQAGSVHTYNFPGLDLLHRGSPSARMWQRAAYHRFLRVVGLVPQ